MHILDLKVSAGLYFHSKYKLTPVVLQEENWDEDVPTQRRSYFKACYSADKKSECFILNHTLIYVYITK